MKLKIKNVPEVVREEDKEVTFSLHRNGDNIDLIIQKEGKVDQVALRFFSDGTIQRLSLYEDIGFKVVERKLIIQ